jgi:predicted DNA-binding protein
MENEQLTHTVGIKLTPSMYNAITRAAKRRRLTYANYVRLVLADHLDELENEAASKTESQQLVMA